MATCAPETVLEDGSCFGCFDKRQQAIGELSLLCSILQALNPMASCDPQTVLEDGACWGCIAGDQRRVNIARLQLLCDIKALLGGEEGGEGIVSAGDVDPTTAPGTGASFYYNRTDGSLWAWDSNLAAWVKLIG